MILLSLLLCGIKVFAQQSFPYQIDKVISDNTITDLDNQKILIIDFWATWCVPCVASTHQLEIIQHAVPDKVFIVSVSDESEKKISDYLLKNPIALTVIKDLNEDGLINRFNVTQRPYAVMLNMNGEILYKGHPSGITIEMINKLFISPQVTNCNQPRSLFAIKTSNRVIAESNQIQLSLKKNREAVQEFMFTENGIFRYSGPLSALMRYLFGVSKFQLTLKDSEDYGVDFVCSQTEIAKAKQNPIPFVEKKLLMEVLVKPVDLIYTSLEVENPEKLWDSSQIDWGNDSGNCFLIGEDRIEADNLTINEIANLLSDVKKHFFYYKGKDKNVYDWNFQYLYDNLMSEELKYSFGISLKKEKGLVPVYIIKPIRE
jgi:thiol-disulfide isomerase/thioredoxin